MKRKLKLLKKKFEYTAIAVTFAEAGEWETAEDYLEKIRRLNQSQNPKMLVVALNAEFSAKTANYTVNLAERMKYDLLIVNAVKLPHNKSFFNFIKKSYFKNRIRRVFGFMVERAQKSRVYYETFITTNDFRNQIKQLLKQIRQIELVFIQVDCSENLKLYLDVPVFQIETSKT